MSWEHVREQFKGLAHDAWRRRPVRAPQGPVDAALSARVTQLEQPDAARAQLATGDRGEFGRVQMWRRRGLQRKGAHMRTAMAASASEYSLAMLDEAGIVVSWHDGVSIGNMTVDDVVDEHVSQFYVLEEVAAGVPQRDLRVALANGTCTEQGWRRRAGGAVYWGTTIIRALVNRNGQLQGFSYLTRESTGPREGFHASTRTTVQRREIIASSAFMRDRLVASRASARQRRLFGLSVLRQQAAREELPNPLLPVPAAARSRMISTSLKCVLLVAVLGGLVAPAFAAPGSATLPDNAVKSRYGSGWECAYGFRPLASGCVSVVLPGNAYLEASGHSWKCNRGYLAVANSCALVRVPSNGYADDTYSPGWKCNRGYRELNGACARITVPVNAYLLDTSYGRGWDCDRGFRQAGEQCVAVNVPVNGFLTRVGDDWKCERGFRRAGERCAAIAVPKDAYLDASGTGWQCERGFDQSASACTALLIPADAHLNYSGNGWICDTGFYGRGSGCVAR